VLWEANSLGSPYFIRTMRWELVLGFFGMTAGLHSNHSPST